MAGTPEMEIRLGRIWTAQLFNISRFVRRYPELTRLGSFDGPTTYDAILDYSLSSAQI